MKERIFFVLYNGIIIPLLFCFSRFGTLFNTKLRQRRTAEQNLQSRLQGLLQGHPRYWFHAASSGEFEQVKPIIERLKFQIPHARIIVTFFSPSGFEAHHSYPLADLILYLPLDTIHNVKILLSTIQPQCVIIARYDLWWNLIRQLQQAQIPTVLVCATLNESSLALKIPIVKSGYRMMYSWLTVIYTAGASETEKFRRLGIDTNIITAADTRFDRIITMVTRCKEQPPPLIPEKWLNADEKILVLGSAWAADEKIIFPAFNRILQEGLPVKLIIVPHVPDYHSIQQTRLYLKEYLPNFPDSVLLSEIQKQTSIENYTNHHIIVDSLGHLLQLYMYAYCAFIGGGFGAGVHSVTEPAGYGIPLASGPNIQRARDAQYLQKQGALTLIHNSEDFYQWLLTTLTNQPTYQLQSRLAYQYIHQSSGWSDTIISGILNFAK